MKDLIPVGLGETRGGRCAEAVLVCYGLGSCVSLALYDAPAKVGMMAHIVLPHSSLHRTREPAIPGKFADTALPFMVEEAVRLGAAVTRLTARIVGGARMLGTTAGGQLDIGARNTSAIRAALALLHIPLVAEDTGGSHGRTVQFYIDSGRLHVSTVGRGQRDL